MRQEEERYYQTHRYRSNERHDFWLIRIVRVEIVEIGNSILTYSYSTATKFFNSFFFL